MGFWQRIEKINVPNGTPKRFTLRYQSPLERLTIWAISGPRVLVNVTFQPQLNSINFAPATIIAGAQAADIIYSSGGASAENAIIPFVHPDKAPGTYDPFLFEVLITNGDATAIDVTMIATAIEHNGG